MIVEDKDKKPVPLTVMVEVGNGISSGNVIFTVHSYTTGKFVFIVNS